MPLMVGDCYQARRKCRIHTRRVREIDYAVHEWGAAGQPLLICLHGWGDTGASFQFFADELGEDWHVVAPDWRGFGRSAWNRGAYWFPDYIADLDALLNLYSPDEAACVLGHSMGGNVIGLYAGTFPERVAAFINVEGFGLEDSNPDSAADRYREWVERQRRDYAFSEYPDFESLASRIRKRSPRLDHARALFVAKAWAEQQDKRVVLRADPKHRLPNAVLYRRSEAAACWRRVTAPVLKVAGELSQFRSEGHPHDGAFDFDIPFPDSHSVVLSGAGHMLHFEAPAELARETAAFLAKCV